MPPYSEQQERVTKNIEGNYFQFVITLYTTRIYHSTIKL